MAKVGWFSQFKIGIQAKDYGVAVLLGLTNVSCQVLDELLAGGWVEVWILVSLVPTALVQTVVQVLGVHGVGRITFDRAITGVHFDELTIPSSQAFPGPLAQSSGVGARGGGAGGGVAKGGQRGSSVNEGVPLGIVPIKQDSGVGGGSKPSL